VPSAEDLLCLSPYKRALKEVLDAQQLCFDAKALTKAYAPLPKEVPDMQGIQAHKVDLSNDMPQIFPELMGKHGALVEVPEDQRLLQEEVRELHLNCYALAVMPRWLGELAHLEILSLDGIGFIHEYGNSNDHFNAPLISLPEALGELHVLKTLTIKNLAILEALPKSIGWLSLLETLHIQGCDI